MKKNLIKNLHKQAKNMHRIAIVSERAIVPKTLSKEDHINIISRGTQLSDQGFLQIYEQLQRDGYQHIMSIHQDQKGVRYAEKAAAQLKGDLNVRVFGVGGDELTLGLMIQVINQAIMDYYSAQDIRRLLFRSIKVRAHWVLPFQFDYEAVSSMMDPITDAKSKMKLRLFNHKPLICMKDKNSLVDTFGDDEVAISSLFAQVDQYIGKQQHRIHRIGIEYKGAYRVAQSLKNKLKVKYPGKPVDLVMADTQAVQTFGDHFIGLSVL